MKPVSETKVMLFRTTKVFRISFLGCFSVFPMPGRVFLLVAALALSSAGVKGEDRPVQIRTYAGETVILPCNIPVGEDEDAPSSVEWSKAGLKPKIAFLYRQGCETFHEKNRVFHYRTNLLMNELKKGNLSLMLSNVSLSDRGKYICTKIERPVRVLATAELSVDAVSEPKLSVVPIAGGVTLQCEADCWFPKPEITFLDTQGNIIDAEDTKTHQDSSRGCFITTRRLTVQTANNRFICRVHQPETNHTRVTEIYIPDDCMRSCNPYIISIAVAVAVIIIISALTAFLYKKYRNSVGGHKSFSTQSSQQSSTRSNAESHNQRNRAEQALQEATIKLQRENLELKSNLRKKEELIHQKDAELRDLKSKQILVYQQGLPTVDSSPSTSSPDVSGSINLPPEDLTHDSKSKPTTSTNNNRPKSGNLPQTKESRPSDSIEPPAAGIQIQKSRQKPTPALLTNSNPELSRASPVSPVGKFAGHLRTMSESRSRPKGTKLERSYTFSAMSNNRFAVLEKLPEEDSQPLL